VHAIKGSGQKDEANDEPDLVVLPDEAARLHAPRDDLAAPAEGQMHWGRHRQRSACSRQEAKFPLAWGGACKVTNNSDLKRRIGSSMRERRWRAQRMLPATGGMFRASGGSCLCASYSSCARM
jgi:hypothetical protein